MSHVNITNELNELMKIYEDSEKNLLNAECISLDILNHHMKVYLKNREAREQVTHRLVVLKGKMSHQDCESCGDCDEDEDEDE